MTNEGVKALIDEYGERIFAIILDNDQKILLGYTNTAKVSDITFETIGGTDMICIPHVSKSTRPIVSYKNYYQTDAIRTVGIMDEKDADYRVDPLVFR